ncbi:hypothetical protein [Thaumasiovibrio subtropicus]|uniref:hypothetical protein n=2 Tax=Thaumasiovibrio subtropicus TaxID=1891207 RepID=UPI001C844889|nr:hypothetical protein [Thaumasiovibrio subtropicus]
MKATQLFKIIDRVNSILFLILLIASSIIVSIFVYEDVTHRRTGTVEVESSNSDAKEKIVLSHIDHIPGRGIKYIRVYSENVLAVQSKGRHRRLVNILFINRDNEEPSWLLPNHNQEIEKMDQLRSYDVGTEKAVVDHLYFQVKDQYLRSNVCMSDADGKHYSCLNVKGNQVVSHEYDYSNSQLNLLVKEGNQIIYKVFDTKTRSLISEKSILKM